MPSLSRKDRVSLCSFTFSDGRRCRTPRIRNHPHFCFYHSQKEARARAAEKLGKDLAYFFSGDYLSACDLSTALSRLIPAVVRGDIKLRTARTVAYLAQTLLQAIHISQHEYINAFDTDDWRKSIRNSVNSNHDYLFPPKPEHKQPGSLQPQQSASAPPSHQPAAPTAGALNVAAGLQPGSLPATPHVQPAPPNAQTLSNPPQPSAKPAETPVNCHSEPARRGGRSEDLFASERIARGESAFSSSPVPPPTPAHAQPDNTPRTAPSTPQPTPNRNAFALHFDHNCRLLLDGKPL